MKLKRTALRTLIALFFAMVGLIYAVAWLAPSIGLYHDDAVYLVTAKGILAGHGYVIDSLPTPIPQTKYPPLFPLALAAFAAVSQNPQWLKALPLLCAALWLFVTYKLLRKMGADGYSALLVTGITAASPAVVFVSTNLLSEPLFGLLVAACLLALLDDRIFLAGLLAGLATITRTAGLPLIAACALTLIIRARFVRAVTFTATAILIVAPWLAWSMAQNVHDAYYSGGNYASSSILTSLALSEKAAVLATNVLFLFSGPFSLLTGINDIYAASFTFSLLVLCLWKRRQTLPDIFLLLYCLMLLLWPGPPQRFLAPVLPLILWMFWRSIRLIPRQELVFAIGLVVALLPLGFSLNRLSVTRQTGQFPTSAQRPNDWIELNKLFSSIRANTPPDAILAANLDPLFYLNTGRKAVRGFVPNGYKTFYETHGQVVTPDQLAANLTQNGVSFLALTPDRDFAESPAFHKSVEALERGGVLVPVDTPGLAPEYRLLRTSGTQPAR
jgi:4-amino-4-deoxy-L-arabinose transferase-like glycosyltransferase